MLARHRWAAVIFGLLLAAGGAAFSPLAAAQEGNNGVLTDKTLTPPKGPALLGPVPVSGQWIQFSYVGTGTFAMGCQPADPNGLLCAPSSAGNTEFGDAPPWTFTAPPQGATLTVTDAFDYGEVFEVFDFGTSIGTTSNVSPGGWCSDNPDVCLADPLSSHGVFELKAGPHEITIKVLVDPYNLGAAYFRVDPGAAKADHFVCYRISVERDRKHHKDKNHEKPKVLITNQFGELTLDVGDPELLCVPSTKEVIEAKPKVDAPQ